MDTTLNLNYSQFHENLTRGFKSLQGVESLSDVTLVCDDGEVFAHRAVLFTGSEFFKSFLPRVRHANPYIYLKGIRVNYLQTILDFMYKGEAQVLQDDLSNVLDAANDLKVTGLVEDEEDLVTGLVETDEHAEADDQDKESIMEEATKVSAKLESLLETISKESPMKKKKKEKEKKMKKEDLLTKEDFETNPLKKEKKEAKIEKEAFDRMTRSFDDEGRTNWTCISCDFSTNDKTRCRKHVESKHLKRKSSVFKTEDREEVGNDPVEVKRPRSSTLDLLLSSTNEEPGEEESATEIIHFQDKNTTGESMTSADDTLDEATIMNEKAMTMMEKRHDENQKVSWTCLECNFACSDKTRTKRHIKNNHLKQKYKRKSVSSSVSEGVEDGIEVEDIVTEPEIPFVVDEIVDETVREAAESMNESVTDADNSLKEEIRPKGAKVNYDANDMEALTMMKSEKVDGRTLWNCEMCELPPHMDKTKIRKHVISSHIQTKNK